MVEIQTEQLSHISGGNALDTTTGSFVPGDSGSLPGGAPGGEITLGCGDFWIDKANSGTSLRYCIVIRY